MFSFWAYKRPYSVELSILIGGAAELPLRHLLVKRYIFALKSNNILHDGQLLVLCSLMGVFATAIF